MNRDVLCYFVLPGERADVMLPVDMKCSLAFMTQLQGLIKLISILKTKLQS